MKNNLCENLFDFDVEDIKRIGITNNEIYNQLLLYMFFSCDKNIILVYPTLHEATKTYNEIKKYIDEVYLFPEDDLITKTAIAVSPELLYMRSNILNTINSNNKKILIAHYNSFIKKLPLPQVVDKNKLSFSISDVLNREKIIKKLYEMGYKKESIVYESGDFSIRGYVIDIYPINEENPVRIELFDDEIEKIRYFDVNSQKSISNLSKITIHAIKDEYEENSISIKEYLKNNITIYYNYSQIINQERLLEPQIKYLNLEKSIFKLEELIDKTDKYINTIDDNEIQLNISAQEIPDFNYDKEKFIQYIKTHDAIICATDKKFIKNLNLNNKVINIDLNKGFIYNNKHYISKYDFVSNNNYSMKLDKSFGKSIKSIDNIKEGDYVVHRKSGIGIYRGITTIEKNGFKKDYILIEYKGNDKLYMKVEDISKLYKYSSKEGAKPVINKLNSLEWTKTKLRIKQRIKSITGELLKIYRERNIAKINPFKKDDEEQLLFESEFNYIDTPDQLKTSLEIKKDMENNRPMDRLLCGDVGYGKTEVIFRAMFKAVMNGKQVAYLCPTTILSFQQYTSAIERFKLHAVNIDIINRHFTNKQVKDKLNKLKEGKTDIIIGTHRLLSNDVVFKDLGLLIIDEEHRFGVEQKEKIKKLKSNVHVLSVSATPIPRSLQMSLVGIRDLSLIETAPSNRYPVQTYVIEYNEMLIREVILKEINRGGQAFILYNNILNMDQIVLKYQKLIPEVKICYAHGKMQKNEMQDIIYDFTNGKYDVLVSTTIIENGIDIPNANTIVVIDSDHFGLSQLYQIRGRVGRATKIAYAYLMYKKEKILTQTALKRLNAIKEFTELGSGYKISLRDLSIRGAGDILGKEQAGFIDSVGVDMYMDLINEEVKGIVNKDDETINSQIDVSTHISQEFTDEDDIVIQLHKKIDEINTKEDLNNVLLEIRDRFGFTNIDIEVYAHEKYIEKLLLETQTEVKENDNLKITLKIKKEQANNIKMDKLFLQTMKISTKFNFSKSNDNVLITLLKATLDKNYIFYIEEVLEEIIKSKK